MSRAPHSHFNVLKLSLLLTLLSFLVLDVHAVKYVEITPAVEKYRRGLAERYKRKRDYIPEPVELTKRSSYNYPPFDRQRGPVAAPLPAQVSQPVSPNPIYHSSFSKKHSSHAHGNKRHHKNVHVPQTLRTKRQDLNLSCNNITVTPPGFDGSCAVGLPCPNGACWYVTLVSLGRRIFTENYICSGPSGFCGYGSQFCGAGCSSNCNALAECGANAAPGDELCPLNVCCDKFGFVSATINFKIFI